MRTDNKSQRITLRLNEKQFYFVKQSAENYGVSPSDFLRLVINLAMANAQRDGKFKSTQGLDD